MLETQSEIAPKAAQCAAFSCVLRRTAAGRTRSYLRFIAARHRAKTEGEKAMINPRKTLVATLAAVTLIGAAAVSTTEASAKPFFKGPHWGWGVGAAIGTGLAIAAASNAYGYGDCYIGHRPVYDGYGNVVGYQRIRVCD
jgi:hypothetical protein